MNTLAVAGMIDGKAPAVEFLRMLGKTPIALLITLLVCIAAFAKDYGMARLEKLCGDSLAPICAVILVTYAGGMFGGVLRASGIGSALAGVLSDLRYARCGRRICDCDLFTRRARFGYGRSDHDGRPDCTDGGGDHRPV